MANQKENDAIDAYADTFARADKNRRRMAIQGAGNIHRVARKFVGIKDTRGTKVATTPRLDKMFERKTGLLRQA